MENKAPLYHDEVECFVMVYERIFDIGNEIAEMNGIMETCDEISYVSNDSKTINLRTYQDRCGDTETIVVPFSYLTDPDWKEKEQQKLDLLKVAKKAAEDEHQAQKNLLQEIRDKADFERLKKKFGE